MPGFNVSEFRARAARRGWLHNNKFLVEFVPPRALAGAVGGSSASAIVQDLPFLCEATNLPGISITTSEIRRFGYGNFEKKPTNAINNDVVVSVLGDGRGDAWHLFKTWAQVVVPHEVPHSYATSAGPVPGQTAFEVAYKDEYATDVRITAFDQSGQPAIAVTLREAWPLFVGEVQLNWGDTNTIVRFPVTLTYFSWHTDRIVDGISTDRSFPGDVENFVSSVSAGALASLFGTGPRLRL